MDDMTLRMQMLQPLKHHMHHQLQHIIRQSTPYEPLLQYSKAALLTYQKPYTRAYHQAPPNRNYPAAHAQIDTPDADD